VKYIIVYMYTFAIF